MLGRVLLTIDAIFMALSTVKVDYFGDAHMFNPRWSPHAKYHTAQGVFLAVLLSGIALYYAWRQAPTPRLRREFMLMSGLSCTLYSVAGILAVFPPGTSGIDPEFGAPGFPQVPIFVGHTLVGILGTWLEF
ncbi:hypothetical protein Hte_001710 [Hypoxylon texense]